MERIRKLTLSSSPWVEKIKTDKIWLCESVGKLKGIGKQGEVKMHEIKVHTISDFQWYVQSYGLPKLSISGLGQIYEHALVALPRKPSPSVKGHRKARNPYYSRYGDRWVEKLKSSSSMSKFSASLIINRIRSAIQQNFDMEDDNFNFSTHLYPYLE